MMHAGSLKLYTLFSQLKPCLLFKCHKLQERVGSGLVKVFGALDEYLGYEQTAINGEGKQKIIIEV